jgi:hypothetical protein
MMRWPISNEGSKTKLKNMLRAVHVKVREDTCFSPNEEEQQQSYRRSK